MGDRTSARSAFEKAIAFEPMSGIAQLNLGRLLLEGGQPAAARTHLGVAAKSLKQKDEAAEAYYLLGKIASDGDDAATAATELQRAVEANPRLASAWSDLGAARQLLQNDEGALNAFERAVTLNPSDSIARYRLGSEFLRMNKAHEAVENLEAAYRLNPEDQSTLNALQTALRRDGRSAEADEVRQKLSELLHSRDEKNQAALEAIKLNNQGAALEKAGDLKGAGEKYKAALALYPEHNGIRVNYAVALLRQGQWTEGLKELHEASKRDPQNSQIQSALKDALSQAPPGTIPSWSDAK
jgi:tetratricopeptide (TPR) repeat protein